MYNGIEIKATVSVIIPTYRGGNELEKMIGYIRGSSGVDEIIVVDTRSELNIDGIAGKYAVKIMHIDKRDFDHGYVRTIAGKAAGGNILVYMTQDAMPVRKDSISSLVGPLAGDNHIAAVYGRQIPNSGANLFAAHLRQFNYPGAGRVKSFDDRKKDGIKTAFISNSFSAYKKEALEDIGWFKTGLLLGEDFYAGARLLEKGFKICYAAEATVYHSHNYSVAQEFKRYFDIGVFHKKESWIIDKFGKVEAEGFRFVGSEIKFLYEKKKLHLVPVSLLRALIKYAGYRLGLEYNMLPREFVNRCTMGNFRKSGLYD